ncbi:MAG: hypothetical protein ACYTXY_38475, partial [Nostoc sp.]
QTLESSESSEGDFFTTEGRHVSLGTFKDLKNTKSNSNGFQFTLNFKTNSLPESIIQQIRQALQKSTHIQKLESDSVELSVSLPFSTVTTQDALGKTTSVKITSLIKADELMAEFRVSGNIPYREIPGNKYKHIVTCKIQGEQVIHKEEANLRRTRFLKFPLPNNPIDILKSAFDNLYLDTVKDEIISIRHLSPVREESERSVILG